MKLVFKLATSGEHADGKIPKLKHEVDWAYDETRKQYDRAKLMQSLGNDQVLIGSDDTTNCIAVGATILQEFHVNMQRCEGCSGKNYDEKLDPAKLKGSERNLHKNRVAYVVLRLTDTADGNLKCRVSYANPKGVPGTCLEFAHDIAVYLVQIADAVANEYAHNGSTVRLVVTDHEDCIGLCKEAREDHKRRKMLEKVRWLNERRLMCRCRCASSHCSPCHPKCRFYERGMCVEVKEAL